mmetsp:Transcript_39637/g.63590  ORF Transcript_39637/g.63590 Transcript_39637/m.63590 type:complete len:204 (-) Transcript_39637:935-1546(-)
MYLSLSNFSSRAGLAQSVCVVPSSHTSANTCEPSRILRNSSPTVSSMIFGPVMGSWHISTILEDFIFHSFATLLRSCEPRAPFSSTSTKEGPVILSVFLSYVISASCIWSGMYSSNSSPSFLTSRNRAWCFFTSAFSKVKLMGWIGLVPLFFSPSYSRSLMLLSLTSCSILFISSSLLSSRCWLMAFLTAASTVLLLCMEMRT